ncbi:MAG: hypothetical protein PHD51_00370 [Patescibacteria group bacterium]|nr:hypothetical protein [Patescibacteria group bacterium]MDD5490678.1 hypothetical protein [Patescibacteria group bacterium]
MLERNVKRLFWLTLALVAILVFVACGGGGEAGEEDDDDNDNNDSSVGDFDSANPGESCYVPEVETCTPDQTAVLECMEAHGGGYAWTLDESCDEDEICLERGDDDDSGYNCENRDLLCEEGDSCATVFNMPAEYLYMVMDIDDEIDRQCCELIGGKWSAEPPYEELSSCPDYFGVPGNYSYDDEAICWVKETTSYNCRISEGYSVPVYLHSGNSYDINPDWDGKCPPPDDVTDDDDTGDDDVDDDVDDDDSAVECEDPSLRPPTCLPKGDETPDEVVSKLNCNQKDEIYTDRPCTYKSCEIYDDIYNAILGCSQSTPDADMCNCLDCYNKQIACMKWQDDFNNCYDPTVIMDTCALDRDVCIDTYPEGKCEMIREYNAEVEADSMCFYEAGCATEAGTGNTCMCEEGYWVCGEEVVCESADDDDDITDDDDDSCVPTNNGVEICDWIDNDCDGRMDDVSPAPSTDEHCGSCFNECPQFTFCEGGECEEIPEDCVYNPNIQPFEYPEEPVCKEYDECIAACPYINEADEDLTQEQIQERDNCITECQNNISGDCMTCIQKWSTCSNENGCVLPDNSMDADCFFTYCFDDYFSCHTAGIGSIEEKSCLQNEKCVDVGGAGACYPTDPNLINGDGTTYPGEKNERNGVCGEGDPIEDDACYQNSNDMMCVNWFGPGETPICTGFCPVSEIEVPRLRLNGCMIDETCSILGQDSSGNDMVFCVPDGWQVGEDPPGNTDDRNGVCMILGMVDTCTNNTACVSFSGMEDRTGICFQKCYEECASP